jgi:hypothetical protein
MPAEPVTATERSIIPREILTALAALCFVCSIPCVIIAAIGYDMARVTPRLVAIQPRFTQDFCKLILAMGPFIPFTMIIAGAWNAFRIGIFALGLFVSWAGFAIDLARVADNSRRRHIGGPGTDRGNRMLEAGLICLLFFSLLSLLALSPRDRTRWWRRSVNTNAGVTHTHNVSTLGGVAPGIATAPRTRHGPLFVLHYIITTLGWLVTVAGCAVLLENIRKHFQFPQDHEGLVVISSLYFMFIVMAFFGVSTALLCDSDLYAGFSLALNTFTIFMSIRFAVDITNYNVHHSFHHMLIAGFSLLFAGAVISSIGVMSRRSNVSAGSELTTPVNPNPALP